jgi:hypothetical protein
MKRMLTLVLAVVLFNLFGNVAHADAPALQGRWLRVYTSTPINPNNLGGGPFDLVHIYAMDSTGYFSADYYSGGSQIGVLLGRIYNPGTSSPGLYVINCTISKVLRIGFITIPLSEQIFSGSFSISDNGQILFAAGSAATHQYSGRVFSYGPYPFFMVNTDAQ